MRVIAIIQARMGSTRLPGKVTAELAGQPMLTCVVARTRRAQTLAAVVVATTVKPADDAIARLCQEQNWPCFRGSEEDVLDRYYRAAAEFQGQVVVRITSDCPLIDPGIIDRVVNEFLSRYPAVDYTSNTLPHTFPRGLDVEVISFEALKRAWQEDDNPAWREHVTPYLYRHPEKFRLYGVTSKVDYSRMRWTVDTPEDLDFVRQIYTHFGDDTFTWLDIIEVLKQHPEWTEINQNVRQKAVP